MSSNAQVLLLPARTSDIEGRSLYYLFSVRQVAEVLVNTTIQRVPVAPPHVQGVAKWCGCVLPILSLERCLGMEILADRMPSRDVVVRSVTQNNGGQLLGHYAICRVGAAIRHMELPLECGPGKVPDQISDASCLTAVYSMQKFLLLIVNLEKIIDAFQRNPVLSSQGADTGSGVFIKPSPLGGVGEGESCDEIVHG